MCCDITINCIPSLCALDASDSPHAHGNPGNTKHLYNICTTSAQRLPRWSDIVQMLYKYFMFAGKSLASSEYIGGSVMYSDVTVMDGCVTSCLSRICNHCDSKKCAANSACDFIVIII